jgi:phage portal protein BeeE
MPIKVTDIKKLVEAESQHSEESPADIYQNAVAGLLAPTIQQIQRTLSGAGVMASNRVMLAESELMRAKAEARQATIQARDLAIQQAEELRRLREESNAASRKARISFWWGIAATIIATVLSILVGWLLAH